MWDYIKEIPWWGWILIVIALVALRDILFQRKHTISHNFPVIGHFRYMLERIGPELRQYLVANNREELPFNRIERGGSMLLPKKRTIMKGLVPIPTFMHTNIFLSIMPSFLSKLKKTTPMRTTSTFFRVQK